MPSEPESTALSVVAMAQAGRFTEIRDMFAPQLQPLVSTESLQAAWSAEIDRLGAVTTVGTPLSDSGAESGAATVRTPVTFERGAMTVIVTVAAGTYLTGIQLAPAEAATSAGPWEPPPYADPATFTERDVVVGDGPMAVPGTLSLPNGMQPRAAVVLLGGSGPNDRDATIGRNKPFKDLAWGLAARGIAVLRFDKVTYTHKADVAANTAFTATDEYLPDALAAIELLRGVPGVASVFVLGHSLGGSMAPRVAAADPTVAGLIILGGGFEAMHWSAVRQMRYLASLNPATASAAQSVIDTMTRQATAVDGLELAPATPSSELPFGVPAPYWLDLRGYDPATAAAALDKPIFVLQGGRDYQVTIADDFPGWQSGLANAGDATLRVYDADNHFFLPGSEPSTPAEYETVSHMDPEVISDIADWISIH